jgi:hypothetical protein
MGTKIQGVTLSLRIRDNLLTNINCTKKKKKKTKRKGGIFVDVCFFVFVCGLI